MGQPWDHARSLIPGAYLLYKFCHDRLSSFQVIRILIFFSFMLKSPIRAPKISVFWGFYPKNLGTHRSDPRKALPCAERRVLSSHWSRSDAQCDLWPFLRTQTRSPASAGIANRPLVFLGIFLIFGSNTPTWSVENQLHY